MIQNGISLIIDSQIARADFIENIMEEYADDIETYDALLISMKGRVAKPLSLSYLTRLFSE